MVGVGGFEPPTPCSRSRKIALLLLLPISVWFVLQRGNAIFLCVYCVLVRPVLAAIVRYLLDANLCP